MNSKDIKKMEEESDVKGLVEILRDEDEIGRSLAADALVKIGAPSVRPLIESLKDKKQEVREKAAEALGNIGDIRALEPLIETLDDKNYPVRNAAALALGMIGDESAVEPLINKLNEPIFIENESAAEALGKIGHFRAVKPLISILRHPNRDLSSKANNSLVEIGEKTFKSLNKILNDEKWPIRCDAICVLGWLRDVRAVEPFIDALNDENDAVRSTAAWALGKIGDVRAVEPLIELLTDDYWLLRKNAVKALGRIGDSRAIEPLILILNYDFFEMRICAVEALGNIGGDSVVEPLIEALKDENKWVKIRAAEVLGKIGDLRAEKPLMETKGDYSVRRSVENALERINKRNLDASPPEIKVEASEWMVSENCGVRNSPQENCVNCKNPLTYKTIEKIQHKLGKTLDDKSKTRYSYVILASMTHIEIKRDKINRPNRLSYPHLPYNKFDLFQLVELVPSGSSVPIRKSLKLPGNFKTFTIAALSANETSDELECIAFKKLYYDIEKDNNIEFCFELDNNGILSVSVDSDYQFLEKESYQNLLPAIGCLDLLYETINASEHFKNYYIPGVINIIHFFTTPYFKAISKINGNTKAIAKEIGEDIVKYNECKGKWEDRMQDLINLPQNASGKEKLLKIHQILDTNMSLINYSSTLFDILFRGIIDKYVDYYRGDRPYLYSKFVNEN